MPVATRAPHDHLRGSIGIELATGVSCRPVAELQEAPVASGEDCLGFPVGQFGDDTLSDHSGAFGWGPALLRDWDTIGPGFPT